MYTVLNQYRVPPSTVDLDRCSNKTLGDPFTIARTESVEYLRTWERTEGAFGVDFMICSDLLAAENIGYLPMILHRRQHLTRPTRLSSSARV